MSQEFLDFVSIQLTKNGKAALYVQLYDALRELILNGKLSNGYLLPPVRKLAAFLQVNPGTVVSAYKLLEQNGYIFSRSGSGSYVAEITVAEEASYQPPDIESEFEAIPPRTSIPTNCLDFATVMPPPDLLPIDDFKYVLMEVLDRDQGYAFTYQDSQGFKPLRQAISAYLKEQGIKAQADNVQIISGAQQGIDIVAKAVLRYGDYVFTENPTYPGAIAAFRSRGAKIVEINMEDDGINIQELEAKIRSFRPKLIYAMANIQNPTGYSYSLTKRNRLIGLARRYNAMILEDDYISELDVADAPLAPLKALDRDQRVIYLKSFSKIFMPGLRLAFLLMPPSLVAKVLAIKHTSDISTSGLTQRAFDLYLRKGIWQKHIAAIRRIYLERYQTTMAAVEQFLPPAVTCHRPRGGLTCWLALPEGVSARQVVQQAEERGMLLTPGTAFFPRHAPDRFIRLSFAVVSSEEILHGVKMLGEIITQDCLQKSAK
ncbi:PLP-dependent aminotransferase family protein [Sporomusa acidovorans]|uniref:Histidinol-phosphate aminotransferase n=1 Tax=Sporomusa acidovorans (strain ATCC 49682 / DSM 3132 / Mol) TaxID=1123286 RepID=A0ABZ3J8Q8_SPOA4|nr:PLP-dependent aminotransferase family protein [Sporomusa acidovorans]OZC16727.1 2-aminoadipate transaminase [Sporomusa acidovorans DSM 3132]SDE04582.1 transcriptional regulator, GntR family [Sporomusa acidovorans]